MNLFTSGNFFVGCNYWASHAGTGMWSNWQANVVENDFRLLSENGVKTLRVFPLWPVFQPIHRLYMQHGIFREYRFGEDPLPNTEAGRAGMCEKALGYFSDFCQLAQKHDIKLIVGLITGWMSGRLFVPPALEGLNVLTDPTAIMWQTRFIRHFVSRFKGEKAIVAWDLGNECNCMGHAGSTDEAYVWTSNIVGAIKFADNTRPIVSGMHSMLPEGNNWTIGHQAELTDVLTTHPYPIFTPHCDMDPLNTIRTVLHATAETLLYRGIGGKPSFVEECGTLGPMIASEPIAADFVRTNLFSLWAHDCLGFMWWCANEQSHLTHAPYDWNSVERELGLFRTDMSPKPVLDVLRGFNAFVESFGPLPKRLTDGVCILTREQDTWGVAYSSFILAKQAGLDIEFDYAENPLPDSDLYLLPSLSGSASMSLRQWKTLLDKVKNGAILYISVNSGLFSPFNELTGLNVLTREKADRTININFGENGKTISIHADYKLVLETAGAQVLATDDEGNPMFTVYNYGKGKVFFLAAPLETSLLPQNGAFKEDSPYSMVYDYLKYDSGKIANIDKRNVGLTEHIVNDHTRILVMVNYDPSPVDVNLTLKDGWEIGRFVKGSLNVSANDGAVLEITKK